MTRRIRDEFVGFGEELLSNVRQDALSRLDEVANNAAVAEFNKGVERAIAALFDAGLDRESVVQLLQKHWDMRLSEAQKAVDSFRSNPEV